MKIWVVEIDANDGKGFQPTVGVGLSRDDAVKEAKDFKIQGFKTRIRKYTASTGERGE